MIVSLAKVSVLKVSTVASKAAAGRETFGAIRIEDLFADPSGEGREALCFLFTLVVRQIRAGIIFRTWMCLCPG